MIVNKHGRLETDIAKQIEEEQQADLAKRKAEAAAIESGGSTDKP